MIEAALIQQCADPNLKPAIVERFIERAVVVTAVPSPSKKSAKPNCMSGASRTLRMRSRCMAAWPATICGRCRPPGPASADS